MKKNRVILGIGVSACLVLSASLYIKNSSLNDLGDEALLTIIKNDQAGFEKFIASGGELGTRLNVEGETYTVGELLVKYNRLGFVKFALGQKMKFEIDPLKKFDVYSLSVAQNNPEMLKLILGNQKLDINTKLYGNEARNLLHIASAQCSYKVVSILHEAGLKWNSKTKSGDTALTIAAEEGCVQALSYFKEQGADFKATDGGGTSALGVLRKKKDAASLALADSFIDQRTPASVIKLATVSPPHFYNKRIIPKDTLADRAHLIEPSDRPDDANETAANSEFSD